MNEDIMNFVGYLNGKGVVNQDFLEEIDRRATNCENDIHSADQELQRVADTNAPNIDVEKAAHEREDATNIALEKANLLILGKLEEVRRTLDRDDSLTHNALEDKQGVLGGDLDRHRDTKERNLSDKIRFLNAYGED
jgi:5'-3' exonuclease